ncbi:MAG: 50S ribosomal protein L10 [Candidatus Melainabacteria bacterium GWA2_34_9]|nr:MAG: 50S ribosomal protein L10 [Candidatus Melainabacteria bacterium GWA2_34_9]
MATKAFKTEKVEEIKEVIAKAKVAIVSDYRGLSVADITNLRRRLQKEDGDYTVVKNTLAKLAIKDTKFEGLEEFLKGPSAIAFGFGDEVAPAKVILKYLKEAKKTNEVKGGVLDGKVITAKEVRAISDLPTKPELIAKIMGSLSSPAQGLTNTLNGVARALVIAMEEVRKQKAAK